MSQLKVIPSQPVRRNTGLGVWNVYFLIKFVMLWMGYLNLQILPNLVFAAFLLVPLNSRKLEILRAMIALPVGVMLFYQDTWLPPLANVLNHPGLMSFSTAYFLELAGRFINWSLCGWLLLVMVLYRLVHQWLRVTTFTLIGLAWLGATSLLALQAPSEQAVAMVASPGVATKKVMVADPDNETLNRYLQDFYTTEATRRVEFKPPITDSPPFDLLLINVCSLAWDDIDSVGLRDNPLFQQMDVVFDNFNSVTSYSGPAAIRLLRASCGQASHTALYKTPPEQCLLFDELSKLGFASEVMLNHSGEFEGFIDRVRTQGSLPAPAVDIHMLKNPIISFEGLPIWRDGEVLDKWWQHRESESQSRVALFYNTITLHDGNRMLAADGSSKSADYKVRAQMLLSDLSGFIKQLEQSGRRVVVVIVPEHGAALHGDRMQIPGMREIPSPSITHVPVGIKLVGMGVSPRTGPLHISEPSSFLALSEIISRLYVAQAQPQGLDLTTLLTGLPQTPVVSENAGTVVLEYAGRPYVRIKENGAWLPYPQKLN
ncbi:cellulose biosynthesis protein BcsG [Pseudomonas sp. FFUP_PS_473]|uniref:cellulose biosynthesis protein BcsG n=1 Tax=Pseudomonas sp. FFUP_PS_473 TaxID=2060418 RepID=UPI000C7BB358|nr:cellulose biosynthesis protein BcsG [Pseudomonas sp. FFUP_PS_473]PLP88031.1 cellulose biosynthesis protein BcsG [Pseudomonas sp. FFUP_PS_473]